MELCSGQQAGDPLDSRLIAGRKLEIVLISTPGGAEQSELRCHSQVLTEPMECSGANGHIDARMLE